MKKLDLKAMQAVIDAQPEDRREGVQQVLSDLYSEHRSLCSCLTRLNAALRRSRDAAHDAMDRDTSEDLVPLSGSMRFVASAAEETARVWAEVQRHHAVVKALLAALDAVGVQLPEGQST